MAPLAAGSRLGPYEIAGKLGQGGMGVVYSATDCRLMRQVAIKVLPEHVAGDRERLSRFEREARLLAQLNHPNVAQVYGLEVGDVPALVMEFVEGPTLAERLAAGPLPLDETLSIGRQIAEALEEAHEKGIVHRDLKPQNVKAPFHGKVKVLDFGLAKALDPSPGAVASSVLANSPTVVDTGTGAGVIVGTAAYMSPEQARGGRVDKRADIWAFGVTLYEMLSGARLFSGESAVDVLGAVLRQPVDLDRLGPIPVRLRELVGRCLERDPHLRLRDIGEARIVLSALAERGAEPTDPDAPAGSGRPHAWRWRWIGAAALIGAVGGAALGIRWIGGGAAEPRAFRFQKLSFLPGLQWGPELSPDGRTLFFVAGDRTDSQIYSVPVGAKKPTALTSGAGVRNDSPRLSPDATKLVFSSSRDGGGLFLMGVNGESVRKLAGEGFDPAWSPDARRIAYSTEHLFLPYEGIDGGKLVVLDIGSGRRRTIDAVDAHQPAWSPSGKRIAFWGEDDPSGNREIWTVGVDGGRPVRIAASPAVDWNPVWSDDGRDLYFLSDRGGSMNLWRVGIDEATGRQRDEPENVPLPADEVMYAARSGRRWVFAAYSARTRIDRVDFDPARAALIGAPRTILSASERVLSLAVSPDGSRVAYASLRPQQDIYVVPVDGGAATQLTDDPAFDRWPSWSPDGQRLYFESDRGGRFEIWTIRADGSGLEPATRTAEADIGWSPLLSPDAKRLVTTAADCLRLFAADGARPWSRYEKLAPAELPPGAYFAAAAWSPTRDRLAGSVVDSRKTAYAAVLDLRRRRIRQLDVPSRTIAWYPIGDRLLLDVAGALKVLDLSTWQVRAVTGAEHDGSRMSASRDLRLLVTLETDEASNIWMADESSTRD
ncbi:MAG TPA: protein kinase [Vicinamibacterales bacterium]|nr:protein kinase [Vicinamibacterales bacterium]